mmetsp:Transcript_25437/g.63807  ORF Transcript_25437/g.63807 Transcript_25437/m.63807 type:complete len:208 (+) Transcript_25437:652-1275(+)
MRIALWICQTINTEKRHRSVLSSMFRKQVHIIGVIESPTFSSAHIDTPRKRAQHIAVQWSVGGGRAQVHKTIVIRFFAFPGLMTRIEVVIVFVQPIVLKEERCAIQLSVRLLLHKVPILKVVSKVPVRGACFFPLCDERTQRGVLTVVLVVSTAFTVRNGCSVRSKVGIEQIQVDLTTQLQARSRAALTGWRVGWARRRFLDDRNCC